MPRGKVFRVDSRLVVLSGVAYLWRHVIGRPAESVGRFVEVDLKFTHAEVRNSDVALIIKQEIVQLEVSVMDKNKFLSPSCPPEHN